MSSCGICGSSDHDGYEAECEPTAVDVDALDKLREAATAGEWTQRQDFIDQGVPDNSKTLNGPDGSYLGTVVLSYRGEDNAPLIVAAVNALPALIAEVRRGRALREAMEGLRQIVVEMEGDERDGIPPHVPLLIEALRGVLADVDAS